MTYYIRNGNTYYVTDEAAVDIQRSLPAGNYIIKENPQTGQLYLEQVDSFQPLGKLYGKVPNYCDRILHTFQDRPNSTGAMFTGEKGSGKSLLAKEICIEAARRGLPTIIINAPLHGDKFNNLIQDISQEAVILFDEFEKVYHDSHKQEAILTLLDGVFPTKKLFILTCNDKWRIDQHMRNRPGRLFYMIDFKGLDSEFIIEYCEDNLKNKVHIPKLVNLASLFAEFNFDMLKAVVEDMNRYDETPQEALSILNAKPEYEKNSSTKYDMVLITPCGTPLPSNLLYSKIFNSNPLNAQSITIELDLEPEDTLAEYDEDSGTITNEKVRRNLDAITLVKRYVTEDTILEFKQEELVKVDGDTGVFEYMCEDTKFRLRLTRQKSTTFNYFSML